MEIRELMQKMHNAPDEEQKQIIVREIESVFKSLSDTEKEFVRKEFMSSLDDRLAFTKNRLAEIDISMDIMEVSKYVSLSRIASDYFGKSKEWLYQRVKGYSVNGKPAAFTPDERRKLSEALQDINRIAQETALRIV